jgi:transposase
MGMSFSPEERRLGISLDFERGGAFRCPECGTVGANGYDSQEGEWRRLNSFQCKTHLRARVPWVTCPRGCGPRKVEVSWACPGVLNWSHSRLTRRSLEGINSLVQAAKTKARGYRTTKNLITMAYLLAGKLGFALPT